MKQEKSKIPHIGLPAMALALVVAIGAGLWVAQRGAKPSPPLPIQSTSTPDTDAPQAPSPASRSAEATSPPAATTALVDPAVPREEEDKLFNWLTESESPAAAGTAILADWKNLSEPGKVAAARHLTNLVADEQFESVGALLLGESSSRDVKEVIFAAILNRPDEIKWPLIVKVMEQKNNPFSQDARNMLSVVLGADFGDDWARWRERVQHDLLK